MTKRKVRKVEILDEDNWPNHKYGHLSYKEVHDRYLRGRLPYRTVVKVFPGITSVSQLYQKAQKSNSITSS